MSILHEAGSATATPPRRDHAVQFYNSDACLANTVAGFLADGLVAHQPAIVVATQAHRAAMVEALGGRRINCQQAIRDGDLVVLDAEETLDLFVVGDSLDASLFDANVGRLVDQTLNGRQRVVLRAYGEMVDVLCWQGRPETALKLEMLWNTLAAKYNLAILCGYAKEHFCERSDLHAQICAQHSHVVAPGGGVVPCSKRPRSS